MFTVKPSIVIGVVGIVFGCVGAGFGLGQRKKLNDISEKLDKSMKDIEKSVSNQINISNEIIEVAVNRAVQNKADVAAQVVIDTIRRDISKEVSGKISEEIRKAKESIREKVEKDIQRQVDDLDIEDMKRDVTRKAKDEALRKLNSNMTDILDGFNGNLRSIQSIYKSISDTLDPGKAHKTTGITLGFN